MKSKLFVGITGERFSILFGQDDMPMLYPNLFITVMYRNDDQSSSSCKKALEHISYFYQICKGLNIDIEKRCEREDFLSKQEIQKISYYAGITQKASKKKLKGLSKVTPINRHKSRLLEMARHNIRVEKQEDKVFWQTKYNRLSVFGRFVGWLESYHYPYTKSKSKENFFDERPEKNEGLTYGEIHELLTFKALNEIERNIFLDRIRPDYLKNPWVNNGVQHRNYTLAIILYALGIRIGEALNIKLEDFKSKDNVNYVLIKRNPNDSNDPRINQPKVKTKSRSLALSPQLKSILDNYILEHRSRVIGAAQCPFLFISHRIRNNMTLPLSISGAEKVFKEFGDVMGLKMYPHRLRHTWNDRYSESADKLIALNKTSEEKSESDRCNLMGWIKGSTMSKVYAFRHNSKRAMLVGLELQDKDFDLKESLVYDDDIQV